MPSTGFYLFLPFMDPNEPPKEIKCQCPQRASTYFFCPLNEILGGSWLCQCPQRASTYFFANAIHVSFLRVMCQCPQRASTYFFHYEETYIHDRNCVSMPSTGFYLFLRRKSNISWNICIWCQCPQRASTYFFAYIYWDDVEHLFGVNALNGLLLISSYIMMKSVVRNMVCQCPQRASTYFFWTEPL